VPIVTPVRIVTPGDVRGLCGEINRITFVVPVEPGDTLVYVDGLLTLRGADYLIHIDASVLGGWTITCD
jgi:hypothetical protein